MSFSVVLATSRNVLPAVTAHANRDKTDSPPVSGWIRAVRTSITYRFPPALEFSELPAPPDWPGVPAFCVRRTSPPGTLQTVC